MPEEPTYDQAGLIEAAKARDIRLRYLDLGLEVEAELRRGGALNALLETLKRDGADAMREFAYADLGDHGLVMSLQARAYRYQITFDSLNGFLVRGQQAAAAIQEEDGQYMRNEG